MDVRQPFPPPADIMTANECVFLFFHARRPVVHLVARAHRSEKAQIISAPYKARSCPEKAGVDSSVLSLGTTCFSRVQATSNHPLQGALLFTEMKGSDGHRRGHVQRFDSSGQGNRKSHRGRFLNVCRESSSFVAYGNNETIGNLANGLQGNRIGRRHNSGIHQAPLL
jgi:hypothetical protein